MVLMDIPAPRELLDGEEEPVVLGMAEAFSDWGDVPVSEVVPEHHDSESISPSVSAQ